MKYKKIIIIIPAKNEEKNILAVINNFKKYADILIIDDNSSDQTYLIVRNKVKFLLKNKKSIGYEKSILRGIKYTFQFNYSYILTADADGQHNHGYVDNFYKEISNKKYDIIFGKRNLFNRYSEEIISKISKILFNIKDPLTGMKCYNIFFLRKNFTSIKNFDSSGMFFLKIRNFLYKEISIKVNTSKKESSFGTGFNANLKLLLQFSILVIYRLFLKISK